MKRIETFGQNPFQLSLVITHVMDIALDERLWVLLFLLLLLWLCYIT